MIFKLTKTFLYISLMILASVSCKQEYQENDRDPVRNKEIDEALMEVNQYMARRNEQHISNFVRRTEWPMKKTKTGLWYWKYDESNGETVEKDDYVAYSYQRKLISGEFIDSIPQDDPAMVQLGQGGIESGIEEGLLKMKVGDKAKFILPPHLAYGNFGDRNNIPPGAILIYDVFLQSKK